MSVLLVDLGNTRIKCVLRTGARLGRMQAQASAAWRGPAGLGHRGSRSSQVSRVIAVSVASAAVERAFTRQVRTTLGCQVEFVRSERRVAGITNAYRDVWRLGSDRWVAMLGARHLFTPRKAVLVVDIGTAMTIDLVSAAGQHRGGQIIPGPDLMIASLLRDTSGIARRATRGGSRRTPRFARDTRSALQSGACGAVVGAIEVALRRAVRELGARPELVVTGGAASDLRRMLPTPHHWVPNLVLRGLAVWADANADTAASS